MGAIFKKNYLKSIESMKASSVRSTSSDGISSGEAFFLICVRDKINLNLKKNIFLFTRDRIHQGRVVFFEGWECSDWGK